MMFEEKHRKSDTGGSLDVKLIPEAEQNRTNPKSSEQLTASKRWVLLNAN